MSGTYQISTPGGTQANLELFPSNPLYKSPRLDRVATSGVGEPIFAAFFEWSFSWDTAPRSDALFFENRYVAGCLYYAKLPHPRTGIMTSFTGVTIEDVNYSVNDVERDSWVNNYSVSLRCSFYATGGF